MLQKVGMYKITGNAIEIRQPNPSDLLVSWANMSKEFKKDFLNFWFETILLTNAKSEKTIYGINPMAYKQLLLLDHITYLVNKRDVVIQNDFLTVLTGLIDEYGEVIDKMISIVAEGGKDK